LPASVSLRRGPGRRGPGGRGPPAARAPQAFGAGNRGACCSGATLHEPQQPGAAVVQAGGGAPRPGPRPGPPQACRPIIISRHAASCPPAAGRSAAVSGRPASGPGAEWVRVRCDQRPHTAPGCLWGAVGAARGAIGVLTRNPGLECWRASPDRRAPAHGACGRADPVKVRGARGRDRDH
jgi:hypothetical protein